MFEKLQSTWKVGGWRLFLILLTFALGGSFCGIAGRKIMGLTKIDKGIVWLIVYIMLVTVIWPLCVIMVSIPLGQFTFFRSYIRKIFGRMGGKKYKEARGKIKENIHDLNIAIFASGTGTNAEKIIQTLPVFIKTGSKTNPAGCIALIITDNPNAGVLDIAIRNNVPAEILSLKNKNPEELAEVYLSVLRKHSIDFLILAGYLKKIPAEVIKCYRRKIVNIHPALLPAYGGAGMFGSRVHEAVIKAREKESGITIHYADEIYDNGEILFQAKCEIGPNETPDTLAEKIHILEYRHYAEQIACIIQSQNLR